MNPKIEIKYLSEDKDPFTVTLDGIRNVIGQDFSIPKNVEEFTMGIPNDKVKMLEIKINGVAVWTRKP